jgi:hypothetical protein
LILEILFRFENGNDFYFCWDFCFDFYFCSYFDILQSYLVNEIVNWLNCDENYENF